jgi:hypothetical protein
MQPQPTSRVAGDPAPTTVYVDVRALETGGACGPPRSTRLEPAADPALAHLAEAGFRMVLVGAAGRTAVSADGPDPAQDVVAELPADAEGWLVSDDAAVCAATRGLRRLRTILVGPAVRGRGLADRPSDVQARTLLDAVLTILGADAMPSATDRGAVPRA